MNYTIKEVAKMLDTTAITIRYYDKEGLLPFVQRKESGYRIFTENDINLLKVIKCLKNTGTPIKEIKKFVEWVIEGNDSLEKRHNFFLKQKKIVEKQMAELQKTMDLINHKCKYYEKAIEAGTEAIHFDNNIIQDKFDCEI